LENIQESILKKIHWDTKVWCIQLCTLIIDTAKLTKIQKIVASIGLLADTGRNQQNCYSTLQSSISG
jgi:hypothetical protein